MNRTIGFIGAGKMAEAMIGGMISEGVFPKEDVLACAPSEETRARVGNAYGIKTYETAE